MKRTATYHGIPDVPCFSPLFCSLLKPQQTPASPSIMAAPDDPLPVSESGATDNNRDSNIKKTLTEARRLFMKHQEHSEALKAILKAC